MKDGGLKGGFSVRSFYAVLLSLKEKIVDSKWCWNKPVSLKVQVFCWLARL